MSTNLGAGTPASRDPPPPSRVPVSTGGLFPRSYRRRLKEASGPFAGVTEFDSATVQYAEASPLIGTALHWSNRIREDLVPFLEIPDADRYYDEDPETHRFLGSLTHTLTPNQSRYEFDLNRPADTAVYTRPELSWGVNVWKEPLQQWAREFSLEKWYEFHTMMDCAVEDAIERFGYAVVFDIHSYNYQRDGPADWRTDGKPVVNLGTRHLMLDERGESIVKWFMDKLNGTTVLGEDCLVEENGVFYGGYLNRRLSHLYGDKCVTLSVEYKKVYMDEKAGKVHDDVTADLVSQFDGIVRDMGSWLGAPVRQTPVVPKYG